MPQRAGEAADEEGVIRVLVVDDSSLIRRLVTTALAFDREIEVVGTAVDGLEAVRLVDELRPDAVTLDIEMPVMDGLAALTEIRTRHPRLPVIMFSTLTEKGATATLEALARGASDYVTKPSNTGSVAESMAQVREQVVPRLKALTGARRVVASAPAPPVRAAARTAFPELLVIGCSTGGPDALSVVLAALPASLPVPVLVVQHMPPVFTTMFAERLDRVSPLTVREAVDGEPLHAGEVLVAPGDFHVRLRRTAGVVRTVLDQEPQENFCRPAVDALFRSAAEVYADRVVACVLTGMGQDGLVGAQLLAGHGAPVVVQDEESSVVWGMPGAVAGAGLATDVLPLPDIAPRLAALVARAPSYSS